MKKKIIVFNRIEQPVLQDLQRKYEVHFFKDIDTNNNAEFIKKLYYTEGIIGLSLEVDSLLLSRAPNLKIVSNNSVGYDNLNIEELTKRNIMATNTPDVLTNTVADTIFGLLVATARRMPELDNYVKERKWTKTLETEHFGTDVHQKTLGIIGMGEIGQAIAQRANKGFNMEILYHTRSKKIEAEKKYKAIHCSLEDLLKRSDFICLMTPLTPETEGFIGKREFQLMKKTAIFINGSRGKTVVEKELIDALNNQEIAGAGLDVFEEEPISPHNPLLDMKNVVTLPHVGSSTVETELKMSELAASNLESGLKGIKPPNLINPSVWLEE